MDFFEHQRRTRRNTVLLLGLFAAAVVAIVAVVYTIGWAIYSHYVPRFQYEAGDWVVSPIPFWDRDLFTWVAGGCVGLIAWGTADMWLRLRAGGPAVAKLLGGRPIEPATVSVPERRLRNIVEEMAIASGLPVPQVFVLPAETSINAFAAGFRPADAVVAVTDGTLRLLNRDELQGVVAHEFSHILNGDMRLNLRLTSVLHGILSLAILGRFLLQSGTGRKNPLALPGLALFAIGWIGVLFGRIIKGSVSRQREFLADASAVQFTRNPDGIAGALKKIGGYSRGSRIASHHAETASHMFIGNALADNFLSWMATHPPIGERIRRIDPSFDESYPSIEFVPTTHDPWNRGEEAVYQPLRPPAPTSPAGEFLVHAGNPGARHLEYAGTFLTSLPASLAAEAHDPEGAQSLVFALLLDGRKEVRERQLASLRGSARPEFLQRVLSLDPQIRGLGVRARLPLLDLAMPALRQLPRSEIEPFLARLQDLIRADETISVFEFALSRVLRQGLRSGRRRVLYRSLTPLVADCQTVLTALAREGASEEPAAARAFAAGFSRLTRDGVPMRPFARLQMGDVHRALGRLASASYSIKQDFLEAAVRTVQSDGSIGISEGELLRAVASALDVPIPPIVREA
jgi:Zn-dependent protease with chaperone function